MVIFLHNLFGMSRTVSRKNLYCRWSKQFIPSSPKYQYLHWYHHHQFRINKTKHCKTVGKVQKYCPHTSALGNALFISIYTTRMKMEANPRWNMACRLLARPIAFFNLFQPCHLPTPVGIRRMNWRSFASFMS